MGLVKKATKSMNDLRGGMTFTKDAKTALATLLEDIIENMKQQRTVAGPLDNGPTTAACAETFDAATQTDEPTISVDERDIKAIDRKQDAIINILTKDKAWAQIADVHRRSSVPSLCLSQ
jgi:hypothetical protein